MLKSGNIIRVLNLTANPQFNGSIGSIERFDAASGRYSIEVRSNGVSSFMKLRPENVEVANAVVFKQNTTIHRNLSTHPACNTSERIAGRCAGLSDSCYIPVGTVGIEMGVSMGNQAIGCYSCFTHRWGLYPSMHSSAKT
jgi:hypothetical protein